MAEITSQLTERKYKTVECSLPKPLSKFQKEVLASVQAKFSRDDMYFIEVSGRLQLCFRTINLLKLKSEIENIDTRMNPNEVPDTKHALQDLVSKIEAIRSYGVKSGKRIYVDYNAERKVSDRLSKVASRSGYYYARDNDFKKEQNSAPEYFLNHIIWGDSSTELKKLPDNCIDLTFTSPPYNFGLGYDTTNDGIHWENYFNKLFEIFEECVRITKFGGRIIVNTQPLFSDYIPSHHIISNFFVKKKMIWKGEILWEKNNYNCKYTAWGSWKSPSNPYLKYTWEFLEIFQKGDLKKEGKKEDIDISADEFKKWVLAKWVISPERNMKKFNHPAMFPEELVERVLKLFSFRNDIVLDPFNGVGSTTAVAKKLGRRYIGIDISKEYCKVAEDRLRGIL